MTRLLGRFWTVANVLSLIRLILVVPVTYLILTSGSLAWLFGLLAVGVATDWLDGRVARWSKTVSEWGKVLDPLADKVAAAMIVTALVVRPDPPQLPVWFLVVLVARDALIVLGGAILARRTRQVVMSAWAGKIAVGGVTLTVLAALLRADPPIIELCVGATTILLVYSFFRYAIRYIHLMRRAGSPDTSAAASAEGAAAGSDARAGASSPGEASRRERRDRGGVEGQSEGQSEIRNPKSAIE